MTEADISHAQMVEEMAALRRRVAELEVEKERSEVMFHSLVDSVPDIIYRLDSEGRILFISDAVRKYGYEPEELIGSSIFALLHPGDREKASYRVNERRTGDRRTQSLQVRLLNHGRDPVAFEFKESEGEQEAPTLMVNAEGIYSSEQPKSENFVCTQGVARDISDRLRAEQAQRDTERVKVFTETAGAAAHEINQPLTVIIGTVEIMLEEMASEDPDRPLLQEVLTAGERINEIVQKMRTAHRYVTKPYTRGSDIADFDASSQEDGEDE